MVQKRIRKASLSQALREGQERHLSDGLAVVDAPAPKPETATVTPLTVASATTLVEPQGVNNTGFDDALRLDQEAVIDAPEPSKPAPQKAAYDPILPFVAPILRPQPPVRPVPEIVPEIVKEEPSQPEPVEVITPPVEERFRVSEVVQIKPEAAEISKLTPPKFTPPVESATHVAAVQKEASVHNPVSESKSDSFVSETPQKPAPKPMNKPIIPPVSDGPTSLSSLGRHLPSTPRHLRHSISDEELEILNAAKTRIEMRLFWVSIGIAVGSSIGAVPSLMLFNETHILSLSGFFQNILFFAFTLLSIVLGVILVVKSQDIKRAYRDITERSRARDD